MSKWINKERTKAKVNRDDKKRFGRRKLTHERKWERNKGKGAKKK